MTMMYIMEYKATITQNIEIYTQYYFGKLHLMKKLDEKQFLC